MFEDLRPSSTVGFNPHRGKQNRDEVCPYYLACENEHNLYLNLIDTPTRLFRVESFRHSCEFAACKYVDGHHGLLIHCIQGESRAPSLAMLFMAKDLHVLPDDSYAATVEAFAPLAATLPRYQPGLGIAQFMAEHWSEL